MKIRTRITLWYAGALLASFLLLIGVMYYELIVEREARAHGEQIPVEVEIAEVTVFYGVPTLTMILFGSLWVLRRALEPLDQLTRAAEKLQADNLHQPLPRTGNGDEVDRLSEVLNTANARIEDAFMRVREFTLHASHELRTPLAILHGEIETTLADPATPSAQREACASQLDEIRRLAKIVEDLSLLAKADAGQAAFADEAVALDQLVRDSHADALILGEPSQIQVELGPCDPVQIQGDRHRLRQLLLNLTDNAIKYNQRGGKVRLSLERQLDTALLTITNTGAGIPPEMLPKVFDRFFRGDPSHSSETEGSGLGLSICEWIVKMHRGEIKIASELGKSTAVTVAFPLVKC